MPEPEAVRTLKLELAAARGELEIARSRLAAAETAAQQADRLRSLVLEHSGKQAELAAKLENHKAREAKLLAQLADGAQSREALRGHILELERQASARELARIELDEALRAARAEIERLRAGGEPGTADASAAELRDALGAARAEIERLRAAGERHSRTDGGYDDLTAIRGIGPKFARKLRSFGVNTYAQIAEWTESDVSDMARRLRVTPARIRREGWSERARQLARR